MKDPLFGPGSVFLLKKHFEVPINDTGVDQIFYDSQRNPVVVRPGEPMYQKLRQQFKLSDYFISSDLWEAQRKLEEMRRKWGCSGKKLKLALRNDAPGIGDMVMATCIPKAFKEAFGKDVIITVFTTDTLKEVLYGNPYIDEVSTRLQDCTSAAFDLLLNVNEMELKCEPRWHEVGLKHKRNRTAVLLSELGLWLINKTPVYVVSEKEKKWAKRQLAQRKLLHKSPIVGVSLCSSAKARTYAHIAEVVKLLKKKGYSVVLLDEKDSEGRYVYSIREVAALINECDVVVAPDSALLHIAGALKKRIVGLFGHTDGRIFCEDYEKASVLQGTCPLKRRSEPCWWKLECVEGGKTYRERSNFGFVSCLSNIKPNEVVKTVEKQLREPSRILIALLTYNNLVMTKKAYESIRSWHNYDVFVIDNKSTDGTTKWLKEIGVEFVSKKSSVAEAQNIAIKKALEGDYDFLLLLNNDLVLRADYIDEIVAEAKATGAQAMAGTVLAKTPPWDVDEAIEFEKGHNEEVVDLIAGDFSATLLSRECLEKVGFFDEQFTPRYIEDNDYILRLRLGGGKFLRTSSAQYYHCLGAVIRTLEDEKKLHEERWNKNIAKFEAKWGIHPHSPQVLQRLGLEWFSRVRGVKVIDAIEEALGGGKSGRILVQRSMGGYGDIIFSTVIGRALKERYKERVHIHYSVPQEFVPLLRSYPYIDSASSVEETVGSFLFTIDITDLEFRVELQEISKHGEVKTPRSKIYLDVLGVEGDIKPEYFPTKEELQWAENEWGESDGAHRVVVVLKGSNKLKEWPGMPKVVERLRSSGQNVKVLDEGGKYAHTFREACALVARADVVISPDSGISNAAAALNVPTVTIFSNRNGKVFAKMFESMIPVQGSCPYLEEGYCDFKVPCFGTGPHRAKENIDIPMCLKGLSVDRVYSEAQKVLHSEVNK